MVLLKNVTRELRTYNVGDRNVTVRRMEHAVTKSGQVGMRVRTVHVSSSITFLPGEVKRVPECMLKQRNVQRDIQKRLLKVVQAAPEKDLASPQPAVEVQVASPLLHPMGTHPVVEEGSVKIADFRKKARRRGRR